MTAAYKSSLFHVCTLKVPKVYEGMGVRRGGQGGALAPSAPLANQNNMFLVVFL